MPVKRIVHPTTKQTVCFGRKRPAVRFPSLRLKNYLLRSLPAPPASVDYSAAAMPALKKVYMNDSVGDCVIAAQAHLVGVFTGNAGSAPIEFTDGQIVNLYSMIGGYVPGDPSTDNGCDMQTSLAFQHSHGFMPHHALPAKHRISGWVSVDPNNIEEMKTALWLFENLDIGLELPDDWISPFPSASGFVWDVAGSPDPDNGHNVCGFGFDSIGVQIGTWGLKGTMTWETFPRYLSPSEGGELYTLLSPDSVDKATKKAPNGFNWIQLTADLQALA